nr:hypothetical protein CDS [Bradyrhizobium sp.]
MTVSTALSKSASPSAAIAAGVVRNQVDSLVAVRGDRQKPSELTHKHSRNGTGIQFVDVQFVPVAVRTQLDQCRHTNATV